MKRLIRKLFFPVSLSVLTLASGCFPAHREFRAEGGGPNGRAEAVRYPLQLGGRHLGKVEISSPGLVKRSKEAKEPLILIELQLKNNSETPITLDTRTLSLELELENGNRLVQPPAEISGDTSAVPRQLGRAQLVFALPTGATPDNLVAFELSWTVLVEGKRISRATVFASGAGRMPPCAGGPCADTHVYWYGWWPMYPSMYLWAPQPQYPHLHHRPHPRHPHRYRVP